MFNLIELPATRVAALAATAALVFGLASHAPGADHEFRILPQVMFGSAGVEPGVALEYRPGDENRLVVRPEVFRSEDNELGAGGSVLWDFSDDADLSSELDLEIGPRIVFHNSDDDGLELGGLAVLAYDLGITRPWRHSLEGLLGLGALEDKDGDDYDLGFSAGFAYGFGF